MASELFRIEPGIGPEHYKTYQIVAPVKTHFRPASCKEVDCPRWVKGFRSTIDTSTPAGVLQAGYIEKESGRRFSRSVAGSVVTYTFTPGQQCFTDHRVALEREPFYVVRGGDHRGNPRGTPVRRHNARDWVNDFQENQQSIIDVKQKG